MFRPRNLVRVFMRFLAGNKKGKPAADFPWSSLTYDLNQAAIRRKAALRRQDYCRSYIRFYGSISYLLPPASTKAMCGDMFKQSNQTVEDFGYFKLVESLLGSAAFLTAALRVGIFLGYFGSCTAGLR